MPWCQTVIEQLRPCWYPLPKCVQAGLKRQAVMLILRNFKWLVRCELYLAVDKVRACSWSYSSCSFAAGVIAAAACIVLTTTDIYIIIISSLILLVIDECVWTDQSQHHPCRCSSAFVTGTSAGIITLILWDIQRIKIIEQLGDIFNILGNLFSVKFRTVSPTGLMSRESDSIT